MPSKNRVKIYIENSYYHVYNRGVDKQNMFIEDIDYRIFLKYLKEALSEPIKKKKAVDVQGRSFNAIEYQVKNFEKTISLIAFCLMPNHFHLLIKQHQKYSMESFMRSLSTRYVSYFNKKHERVGPLFQGRYKAALVTSDKYLLHLSRYIHLNPMEIGSDTTAAYSSYANYLGLKRSNWLKPSVVLDYFKEESAPEFNNTRTYKSFVENYESSSKIELGDLVID